MNTSLQSSKKFQLLGSIKWITLGIAISFYFYDFLLRVFPSVMVGSLMKTYNVDAETIGLVVGIYFYLYAPMQLPIGILVDRLGIRYLLAVAILICGINTIFFAFAPNIGIVALARLLIGFGSSFAFVAMLYIISHWFPQKMRALLIGIANSIGFFGAVSGEGPLSLLENVIGWRMTVVILGCIGLVIFALYLLVMFKQPPSMRKKAGHSRSFKEAWKYFKQVIQHPLAWINALTGFLIYATTAGFGALWGVSFLQNIHGISRDKASFATSMIYVGWMVGGPVIGHLADRFMGRRFLMMTCSILAFFAIGLVIYLPGIHFYVIYIALFTVGFLSASELLTFSYAMDLIHRKGTGSSVAFTNFVVSIGGGIFQPLVGLLLELFWTGDYLNGVKAYSVGDYQFAMSCFPLCFLLAFFLAFFLKEKPTRKTVK